MSKYIVPINILHFNLVLHLETNTEFVIKKTVSAKKNDIVYIYLAKPYSCIKYIGHVVNEDINEIDAINLYSYAVPKKTYLNEHKKYNYMKICVDKMIDSDQLSLQNLKIHGLGQVQLQANVDRKLQAYLEEVIDL